MVLGLRIDVCTYDGLRTGVPALLRLLDRYRLRASFFVSLGPDRSGRAIFQVLRPGFLAKMRRTRAARTYGWRTALSGTLLPARQMNRQADAIRRIAASGHEVALHGYAHRTWQDRIETMPEGKIKTYVSAGIAEFTAVVGQAPVGFGAPGWQCTAASLRLHDAFGFNYASDTRGSAPFYPSVHGQTLQTVQLPTTCPTLDEALGIHGVDEESFVPMIRALVHETKWPVLVLHAEMEGGRYQRTAEALCSWLAADDVSPMPLRDLTGKLFESGESIPAAELVSIAIPGRAGLVAAPSGLEPAPWPRGAA